MKLDSCILNLNAQQKELANHGTLDFPCAGYIEDASDWQDATLPWHWHDDFEIIYVTKGTLHLHIPSQDYTLFSGECILINGSVLHSAFFNEGCEIQSFVFSPLLISGAYDSIFAKKYVTPLINKTSFRAFLLNQTEHACSISAFLLAFEAYEEKSFGYELRIREQLSHICLETLRILSKDVHALALEPNLDEIRIREMLDYLHSKFDHPITLSDIANTVNLSQRECLRCFSRTISLSPMQYLMKYRITKGAEGLLEFPLASISSIATACGFDSPSHFSKLFKRFYHCTPREYRKASALCEEHT